VFLGPNGELTNLVSSWREEYPQGIDVYNFSVDGTSNYFVIANYADFLNGAVPVLVHNAGYQDKTKQLEANRAAGTAFEKQTKGQVQQAQSGVVEQVTVKTKSGIKTRIDLMGRDTNGNIVCTECKASTTASLTKNQAAAFPEIQRSGATVVGQGKPGIPGGTQIPPTKVDIVRP